MAETALEQVARRAMAERRRMPRAAPYRVPQAAEKDAERVMGRLARQMVEAMLPRVLAIVPAQPVRQDATDRQIRTLLRPMAEAYRTAATAAVVPLTEQAERVQRGAEARSMAPLGIDVFGGEPWLRPTLDEKAKGYASLIRDVGTEAEQRVARIAVEALEKGRPREWVREQVQKAAGITERRAAFIARDQTRKIQGALHEARQTDLGIESYIWRNSRDERVAGNPSGKYPKARSNDPAHGNHWEREGRRFLWRKQGDALVEVLPNGKTRVTQFIDGHPGEPINDRCFAEPVIPGLEEFQGLEREAPEATAALPRIQRMRPQREAIVAQIVESRQRQPAPAPPSIASRSAPLGDEARAEAARQAPEYIERAEMFSSTSNPLAWRQLGDVPPDPDAAWALLQQDWAQGAKRKGAVAMKQAALEEFAFARGVPFSRRNWAIPDAYRQRARAALRLEYERTQATLRKAYPDGYVPLWRGVKTQYDAAGALESWTDREEVARRDEFSGGPTGAVYPGRIPIEHVLTWHGSPGWRNGTYGDQAEWVIIGGYGE